MSSTALSCRAAVRDLADDRQFFCGGIPLQQPESDILKYYPRSGEGLSNSLYGIHPDCEPAPGVIFSLRSRRFMKKLHICIVLIMVASLLFSAGCTGPRVQHHVCNSQPDRTRSRPSCRSPGRGVGKSCLERHLGLALRHPQGRPARCRHG